jgi:hypothetical protein
VDLEALSLVWTSVVLDVVGLASHPFGLNGVLVLESSNDGSSTIVELVRTVASKGVVSLSEGSDGLSSLVKGPPLLVVSWVGVSDSKSVLRMANVLSVVDSSVVRVSSLDLELDSTSQWVWWVLVTFEDDSPGTVVSWSALLPLSNLLVGVSNGPEAFTVDVHDVAVFSLEPSDLELVVFGVPWSDISLEVAVSRS